MIQSMTFLPAFTAICLCLGGLVLSQDNGMHLQIGGYGHGIHTNGSLYSHSYYNNYGNYRPQANYAVRGSYGNDSPYYYDGYQQRNYYSYGNTYQPSVFYWNGLNSSGYSYRSYPSTSYSYVAPTYYTNSAPRYSQRRFR